MAQRTGARLPVWMIWHSSCRYSSARNKSFRTNRRPEAGSLRGEVRRIAASILRHNGGCARTKCSPSGPSSRKESSRVLTALRPGWLDLRCSMRLNMAISFPTPSPSAWERIKTLRATWRRWLHSLVSTGVTASGSDNIPQVVRQPNCRARAEAELPNHLITIDKHFANTHGVVTRWEIVRQCFLLDLHIRRCSNKVGVGEYTRLQWCAESAYPRPRPGDE